MANGNVNTSITITANDKASEVFNGIKKAGGELTGQISTLQAAAASLGVGLSIAGFASMIKGALDAADAVHDLAQKTGITTEVLSQYKLIAEQNGTTIEGMANGMKHLSVTMSEHPEYLNKIGVATRDANGNMRSLDAVMKDVAEKFSGYADGAGKVALAQAVFGKSGIDLIPVLNQGAEGMRQAEEQAKKYGLVLSTDAANAANAFNDKMALMKAMNLSTSQSIAAAMLPAMNKLTDAMLDFGRDGEKARLVGEGLGVALNGLAQVALGLYGAVALSGRALGGLFGMAKEALAGDWIHGNSNFAAYFKLMTHDVGQEAEKIGSIINKLRADAGAPIPGIVSDKPKTEAPKVTATADKTIDEYTRLMAAIQGKTIALQMEQTQQDKVTEGQRLQISIMEKLVSGELKTTDVQRLRLGQSLASMLATEKETDSILLQKKAREEANKVIEKANLSAADSIAQIGFEQSLWGRSADEVQRLTEMRNLDIRAQKEILALNLNETINKDDRALYESIQATLKQADADKQAALAKMALNNATAGKAMADKGGVEGEQYAGQIAQLDAYLVETGDFKAHAKALEDLKRQHMANLVQLGIDGNLSQEQFDGLHWQTQFAITAGWLDKTIGQAATHSRAMFNMNKAAALARAALALPETIMNAYDWGVEFGGIPGGIAAAAVAGAAQLVNMRAIASAQFGGGDSTASAGGGSVASGSLPGQMTNSSVPNQQQALPALSAPAAQKRIVNLVVDTGAYGNLSQFARTLIPALNEAHADGYTLNGVG